MRTNRNLLAVAAALVCCIILVWCSTSIKGGQKTYELQPQITIPEYKTDVVRIIDAYERLMERYMDLTERNLTGIGVDLNAVTEKLDSMDAKLAELSARTARIEKALGIEEPAKPSPDFRQGSTDEYRDALRLGSRK
jgi:hypothetical protein